MLKLETQLKHLLIELEELNLEYKEMKHPEYDKDCELIFRGKAEAYWYAKEKLEGILKWHGVIK